METIITTLAFNPLRLWVDDWIAGQQDYIQYIFIIYISIPGGLATQLKKKTLSKWVHLHLKKGVNKKHKKNRWISWESKRLTLLNCKLKQFKHIEWTPKHIQFSKDRRLVFRAILGKLEFLVFILPAFFFFGFSGGGVMSFLHSPKSRGWLGKPHRVGRVASNGHRCAGTGETWEKNRWRSSEVVSSFGQVRSRLWVSESYRTPATGENNPQC